MTRDLVDESSVMDTGVPEDNIVRTSEMVLHDTAGWRALESYMNCLQEVMSAVAPAFSMSSLER